MFSAKSAVLPILAFGSTIASLTGLSAGMDERFAPPAPHPGARGATSSTPRIWPPRKRDRLAAHYRRLARVPKPMQLKHRRLGAPMATAASLAAARRAERYMLARIARS